MDGFGEKSYIKDFQSINKRGEIKLWFWDTQHLISLNKKGRKVRFTPETACFSSRFIIFAEKKDKISEEFRIFVAWFLEIKVEGRSFISVGIPDSMAYGQRESLSHLLSPVGYNVLSNLFITCLCLNVFFDRICKYLRISGDCLSGAVRKARNRIIKGRNRIASGGRIREFCNQRGVLELPAGFSALEKRCSRFDSSFSLSFFTCLEPYVLFIFI